MDNQNIEQLISTLIICPSNDILNQISNFLLEAQNQDLNILIKKYFDSLITLEHWSWEILSRDTRKWHDDEQEYFQLFSNLSSFNIKLILSNNIDFKTKELFLLPNYTDIIDRIFQQIEKRNDDNDQFLNIILLWFDALALFMHEHIELTSLSIIIYINNRIISDFIMKEQFKIYLEQLKDSSPVITIKQYFYLKTCLFCLSEYFYSKPDNDLSNGEKILEYIADDYINIILIHSHTISSWSEKLFGCITHLIGFLTACYHWIGTDEEILEKFITHTNTFFNYIQSLIDILNRRLIHEKIQPQWLNNETIIINNILSLFIYLINYPDMKNFIREKKKLFEIFLIFDHIKNDEINFFTYRLQSEFLSEKEIKQLNVTKNMNEIFYYYLQQASINPLKTYKKISIEELFQGFLNLSTNDIFKDVIIDSDQLTFFIDLIDEYPIIYNILWSLSFDMRIQEQLRLHSIFIKKLKQNSIDEQIKTTIYGIQWNLNLNDIQHKVHTNITNRKQFDIMISYSQKDKLICAHLYHKLIENGFRVGIDFTEKHENLIEETIQIIGQSRLVIICMSEQYKRNSYCRIQAEYSFKKPLKIIPILVEKSYKPDGWLSFIIGNSKFVDLTTNEYDVSLKLLLNELKNPNISIIDILVVRQQPQSVTNIPLSNLRTTDIRQWTKIEVQQWLKDNQLQHLAELLSDLNGLDLIELNKSILNNSSPENLPVFQDSMKRTGKNISSIEIARLHNLVDEQIRMPVKAIKVNSNKCCRMM